jgi:competence protein ComEA
VQRGGDRWEAEAVCEARTAAPRSPGRVRHLDRPVGAVARAVFEANAARREGERANLEEEVKVSTHFRRLVAAGLAVVVALVLGSGLAAAAKPVPSGKLNINTAGVEELASLPGVGEKLAKRIVAHREKAGAFKATQELMNVRGIGERNYQKLERLITVSGSPTKGKARK